MFSKDYWQSAVDEFRRVRSLVVAALMAAISVAIGVLFIPVGDNLRLMFTYIPIGLSGLVCGPIMGMIVGLVSDLVGCIVHPSGPFFPGYTLSVVLSALTYGLFFYRRRPSLWLVLFSRSIVNIFINAGLGSLWSAIIVGKAYVYFLGTSIIKNLVMLPIEAIILYEVMRMLLPTLEMLGMVILLPQKGSKE